MRILKTLACSLSLLTVICCGVSVVSAPTLAQAANTSVKIRLKGSITAGVVPEGSAEFRARGVRSSFEVEANRVNLANGTVLNVNVNGALIGKLTLTAGRGKLTLEGRAVPAVQKGTVVTVALGTTMVLAGSF